MEHLYYRQKDALCSCAHIAVLHWRLAHDDRGINRTFPSGNRGQVENWIFIRKRIVAGMVTKRPLDVALPWVYIALKNDLRMGRHFQVDGLSLHELDS